MKNDHIHTNKPYLRLFLACFTIASIFVCLLALNSCNTAKKLDKIHLKHEALVGQRCLLWYPVKDSTWFSGGVTDTQYVKGDVIYVNCDSLDIYGQPIIGVGIASHDTIIKRYRIPCPPTKVITVHDTIHDIKLDTKLVDVYKHKMDSTVSVAYQANYAKHFWEKAALWGWGILILIILISIILKRLKLW